MPRRSSPNIRCTVPGCPSEWVVVSRNRHTYCQDHMVQANNLYQQYKAVNETAITTFHDESLDQSILLRKQYAATFLDYEDAGAHSAYIHILIRVRNTTQLRRRTTYNSLMTRSPHFRDFTPV